MFHNNLTNLASTAKTVSTQHLVLRTLANVKIGSASGFILFAAFYQPEKATFLALPALF